MINNCSKFLLLSICFFFSCGIFSQNRLRNACRADDQMKKMCEQHPEMDEEVKKNEYLTQQIIQSKDIVKSEAASDGAPEKYIIPIVFHVFGSDFGGGTTVTDEIVKDALIKTNKDFQGLNPDWTTVDAPFDTIKETMNITFELAKIDPDGNPTIGIVYYEEKSGFGDGYLKNKEIQKYAWNNYKYLNVYIMKDLYEDGDYFNSGVAWYPNSSMSNNNLARVVYNGRYLGVNTDENFRSYLTHEFGHYLNLRHTFLGGCNTENDLVDDTPAQNRSSSRKSCENKIYNCFNEEVNNENYMDYSSCFKMFTHGQIQRMKAALQFDTRNTLWKENNLMATGVKNFNGHEYILKYYGGIFEEEFNNDGIIKGQMELKCINCKFSPTQTPLVRGTDYVLSNSIPEGLQEEIKVINDRIIRIKLLGKANNHEKANSISNLTLTFLPPAIQGNIERLYSDKIKGIKILFNDPYTSHCKPRGRFRTYTHITNFTFADYPTHQSNYENVYDFSDNFEFTLTKRESYNYSVTTNKGIGDRRNISKINIWVDWNQNFIYERNELVAEKVYSNTETNENGDYTHSGTITVPDDAVFGIAKMRVFAHHFFDPKRETPTRPMGPCGIVNSGESQDYGLKIHENSPQLFVDFSSERTKTKLGDSVLFLDQSIPPQGKNINSWKWQFPGGSPSSSTLQFPEVLYPTPGKYDVSLTVATDEGTTLTQSKSNWITSELKYCRPFINFGTYFNVTNIELNTINHKAPVNNAYNHINGIHTDLIQGNTYPITITVNKGDGEAIAINQVRVWADWNYNSIYDPTELLLDQMVRNSDYDQDGNYIITHNITVPLNAKQQRIGLRVLGNLLEDINNTDACGTIHSGNSNDYALNILAKNDNDKNIICNFVPKNQIQTHHPVIFYDQSSVDTMDKINSWQWSFPKGTPNSSNEQNPKITYNYVENYDVTLIVNSANGQTCTLKKTFTAQLGHCQPKTSLWGYFNVKSVEFHTIDHQPGFNATKSYENISTQLIAGDINPITITVNKGNSREDSDQSRVQIWADWDVDGTFENHELLVSKVVENSDYDPNGNYRFSENIIVPLNTPPTHPIPLRIMGHFIDPFKPTSVNDACDAIYSGNAATYLLNIMPPDEERVLADFSLPIKKVNKGESVVFTDQSSSTFNTSITNWYWNFPGGNPATSTQQNPNVSYEIPGVHDVTLIVTNLDKSLTDTITKKQAVTVFFNYCEPNIESTRFFNVTRVQFNTINHQPRKGQATEYPNINTSLVAGENYHITVSANKGFAGEYERNRVQIWADWDVDGTFENHELLVSKVVENSDYDPNGDYRFNENIIVPINISPAHPIPLRIMGHYINYFKPTSGNNACDTIYSGNAATYLLNIMPPDEERVLADFSLPIKKVNKGEIVVFTDQSSSTLNTSITNWYWNFPGGSPATSTQQNPNVSYEIPGVHDVTLIVTNLDKSLTDTITKKQAVTVFFNYCEPSIEYTHLLNITRVQFNTINHQPRKGQATEYPNINTSLVAGENYHITVSANKGFSGKYERHRVQIWADWDVDGTFENHELLVSKVVENSDYDPNGDYRFNENIIVPINISPTHPIPLRIMGHYINYFKPTSGNNACDTIKSGNAATYLLNIMPPDEERVLADFSLPIEKVNKGESVVFTDQSLSTFNTSITNWYWNFPGGNPTTSTQQNPNVSYEIPGVHDVTLIVTNLDKSLTDTITKKQAVTVFFNYCEPNIEYTHLFNVTRVQFNTINHQPRKGQTTEYPNINTSLVAGENYPITVSANKGNGGEYERNRVQIWADWDVDGSFENHELLVSKVVENSNYDPNGDYRFNENIIVPINISPTHPIPLRIMGHYINYFKPTSGNNACDTIYAGNAATYLLNIMPPDEERVLADFSSPIKKVNKGEGIVFTDQSSSTFNTSITNWYWNFTGGNPATSTQQNPNVSYEIPGVYDVTLIVTNLDKSLTDTIIKKQLITVFFNYCEPNIIHTNFFSVTRVQFNTIDHQPRKGQATEYPNINTSLVADQEYPISITVNKGNGGKNDQNRVQIWADWDVDGTFENHERLLSKVVENTNYDPNGDYRFNENIIVPINISPTHPIPLRIMGHYINYFKPTSGNNACDTIDSGNAATYLLNIMPPDEERVLADFSLPIKKVNKGESVVFTDQSSSTFNTSITNWYWNFPGGNPATSTQQSPNVSYEIPGAHDVTLIVTNQNKSLTDTITKKQAVTVFFNYCEPNFNVTRVQFNTIDHQPRKGQATEYPNINTSLVAGENYPITVSVNKGFTGENDQNRVQIWADWDVDGTFENHELLVSKVVENSDYDPNGDYRFNENIIVPINISPTHPIPLRIMGHYIRDNQENNACDTIDSGNAATYLLNIMPPPDEERVLADFSLPTKKVNKGESVVFTDQSSSTFNTSITNWYWNFPGGNPATSTQQNPNVSYEIPGVYDVTLIVTNLDKSLTDTITKKQAVTVFFNYCEPNIINTNFFNVTRVQFNTINHQPRKGQATEYPNINTSLVAGENYHITVSANKGNGGEYERNRVQIWADWDVDGSFENHELLVSKVVENSDYDANGDYRFNENIIVPINISPAHPIPLRIMGHYINYFKPTSGNNACDTIYAGSAATYLLNIMPPDEERVLADFSLPTKKVNKGESVVFTDQSSSTFNTSITNWYWNFSGGNPATSTQQNPNVSYEIPGVYDVTLIVTNLDKSLTDTIIKKQVITVFFNYCEPNFNVTRVQFNTIDHQPRKGQATEYPNINTSLVAGENYPITVSANKGNMGEYERNRVQIWADWDVDGSFENHELLVSKVVENSDYDPNGDYRFNENIIVPINISPAYPIPLRIMGHYIGDNQGNNACDTIYSGNAATYLLNIMPPDEERVLADFSLPTKKVNKGESVVFTDQSSSTFNTSITNWYWNFPGGNPATSTQQNPNVSYEIPGVHDVTLIVTNQDKSLTDTIIKKQVITVFFNYCEPNIINTNFFNVTRVQFDTIDHQPRKGQATEYPNINTSLVADQEYPISITVNKGNGSEYDQNRVQIWADWDVDGSFENHERLLSKVVENTNYDPNGDYRFNENIIVPINISPTHPIPLRIMGHYINYFKPTSGNNACDTIYSGNAATYLLNIMPPDEERVLADFSLPTKKVNKGESVVFTDQSSSTFNTSITNWYWNFPGGNPATSTQQNPSVSYEIPGVHDVTLIVTNLDKSLTDTIIKKQAVTVFFNYCEPNIINTNFFNVTRVQFNTIDHQPRKGQATEYPNINTSLVEDQEYPISITVNKGNGSEYDQNRVQIWADWDVDGSFENHERLLSKVVENSDYDPNGDYRFNENIIVPINISPTHPIPLRIMGHYIGDNQENNACDTIDSGNAATYLLNIMPPDEERVLADFSLPTKKVNKGESVVFTDQSSSTFNISITNWYWNFPGGNPATSTQQNPNISYEIPGVHDVTLIVTNLDKILTDTIIKKQAVTVFFNYCEPNFNVTRVQFNTIDHQPRKGQATEYPNINTSLVAGENYPITVSANKGNGGEYDQNRVQIWADWDVDGTFENYELLVSKVVENSDYDPNGNYRFNENIIVPLNISPAHPIPLRIMGHYIRDNQGNNACDTIETGNAATYLIIISTEPEPTEKPLGIYHRKQVDIMLYPNPSSGIFKLKLKNNINIDQINFLNISGKRIYPKIIQQNDSTIMIDMTGFSQGMYFIQIYNDKNIHTEKIIIK